MVPQTLSSAESLSSRLEINRNIGAFSEARSSQRKCQLLNWITKTKNHVVLSGPFPHNKVISREKELIINGSGHVAECGFPG